MSVSHRSLRHIRRGFTLIELLVVIAIIGVLSTIIIASLNGARVKARDTNRKSDLHQLTNAINLYFSQNGFLPRNQTGWCTYISNTTNGYSTGFQGDIRPFLPTIPLDPTKANQVGDYFYFDTNNTLGNFTLCANLETPTGKTYDYSYCDGGGIYNYCINNQ